MLKLETLFTPGSSSTVEQGKRYLSHQQFRTGGMLRIGLRCKQ